MELKNSLIKCSLALTLISILASAYALAPAKTDKELITEPSEEIEIHADKYQVVKSNPDCLGWCNAMLKAGDYQIEIDYNIIDGEIEQIDDVKASIHGAPIANVYIDRNEYAKISTAVSNQS